MNKEKTKRNIKKHRELKRINILYKYRFFQKYFIQVLNDEFLKERENAIEVHYDKYGFATLSCCGVTKEVEVIISPYKKHGYCLMFHFKIMRENGYTKRLDIALRCNDLKKYKIVSESDKNIFLLDSVKETSILNDFDQFSNYKILILEDNKLKDKSEENLFNNSDSYLFIDNLFGSQFINKHYHSKSDVLLYKSVLKTIIYLVCNKNKDIVDSFTNLERNDTSVFNFKLPKMNLYHKLKSGVFYHRLFDKKIKKITEEIFDLGYIYNEIENSDEMILLPEYVHCYSIIVLKAYYRHVEYRKQNLFNASDNQLNIEYIEKIKNEEVIKNTKEILEDIYIYLKIRTSEYKTLINSNISDETDILKSQKFYINVSFQIIIQNYITYKCKEESLEIASTTIFNRLLLIANENKKTYEILSERIWKCKNNNELNKKIQELYFKENQALQTKLEKRRSRSRGYGR